MLITLQSYCTRPSVDENEQTVDNKDCKIDNS